MVTDTPDPRIEAIGWQTFARPDESKPGATGRPPMITHGRRRMYQQGCRCPECTAANTEYYRARRLKEPTHD